MKYLDYFKEHSEAYDRVVASFDRTRTLYDYLVKSGLLDGASTLFSIGSGDGELELLLAGERGLKVSLVEPSPLFFGRFEANASRERVREHILEAHQQSFEDCRPMQKYDLVVSLLSWFAFGFDRALLQKALSCRADGGTLLICLQAEASPSTRISAASRSSGINLTSEALSKWCTTEGFTHDYDTYHGLAPVDRFINGAELTEVGRDLVSFLTATPWRELSTDLRSLGLKSLLDARKGDLIDFQCGCLIFKGRKSTAEGTQEN